MKGSLGEGESWIVPTYRFRGFRSWISRSRDRVSYVLVAETCQLQARGSDRNAQNTTTTTYDER